MLCSGRDPSKLFHRSVNKRHVPDYYDIIKEPMALSILKQKINKREYTKFEQFVRDCALVSASSSTCLILSTLLIVRLPRSHTMRRLTTDLNRWLTKMRLQSR
jgi:Bromodomain